MWGKSVRRTTACVVALVSLSVLSPGQDEKLGASDRLKIVAAVRPALVQVEYWLRYDKGEAPSTNGWGERCPNCGRYHGYGDLSEYVAQERPLEYGGYLVAPDLVLTLDPLLADRFVERIAVRAGDTSTPATLERVFTSETGVILQLEKPLAGRQMLEYSADAGPPFFTVCYQNQDADWSVALQSLSHDVIAGTALPPRGSAPGNCVIVDRNGRLVGASMRGMIAADDSWRGSPLDWPALTAAQLADKQREIDELAQRAVLPARLTFRSPRTKADRNSHYWDDDEGSATEQHVPVVLLPDRLVLVCADLQPDTTARLEQIQLRLPDGSQRSATFAASLRNYGALVARLDEPLDGAAEVETADIRLAKDRLMIAVEYLLFGESYMTRVRRARIPSFELGRRRQVLPSGPGSEVPRFVFTPEGALYIVPLAARDLPDEDNRWRSNDQSGMTPLAYIANLLPALADNADEVDTNNVPLSEQQESRLAWLGVELQSLDRELARVNNVSDLTQDGQSGALVSYVYPDSPAAKAGLEVGVVLLRLHPQGYPRPIPITGQSYDQMNFPWERLDEVPEEYFDQIPRPWSGIDSNLNEMLTKLGFGRKFSVECFRDGKPASFDFEVTESPQHFDTATRYESKRLGVTVRDLTFEVRRYFQKDADDPGVIISKIERGSKASVAGLRPYEIVSQVNDQPVANVAEFEKALSAAEGELRLTVQRMTRNRVVKIRLDPGGEAQSKSDLADEDNDAAEAESAADGARDEDPGDE